MRALQALAPGAHAGAYRNVTADLAGSVGPRVVSHGSPLISSSKGASRANCRQPLAGNSNSTNVDAYASLGPSEEARPSDPSEGNSKSLRASRGGKAALGSAELADMVRHGLFMRSKGLRERTEAPGASRLADGGVCLLANEDDPHSKPGILGIQRCISGRGDESTGVSSNEIFSSGAGDGQELESRQQWPRLPVNSGDRSSGCVCAGPSPSSPAVSYLLASSRPHIILLYSNSVCPRAYMSCTILISHPRLFISLRQSSDQTCPHGCVKHPKSNSLQDGHASLSYEHSGSLATLRAIWESPRRGGQRLSQLPAAPLLSARCPVTRYPQMPNDTAYQTCMLGT